MKKPKPMTKGEWVGLISRHLIKRAERKPVAFRLNVTTCNRLKKIADEWGVSQQNIVELAINKMVDEMRGYED